MHYSSQNPAGFTVYALSENAVTLQFSQSINDETFHAVNAYNELLNKRPFPGMQATVPAYATLSVFYDVLQVTQTNLPGKFCYDKVAGYLQGLGPGLTHKPIPHQAVTIPVCYGGDFGPDIEEVGRLNNMTADEVIKLHSAVTYKVFMIGFVPGFAYLGGMHTSLATPRRSMPRKAVRAGSVGIAGAQTGIYPMQTPGGWQLIGQTPLHLFDAQRKEPALLKAGDEVIFQPITNTEFYTYLT